MYEKIKSIVNHSLPYIFIDFIDAEGKKAQFYSAVNELNGDRLSGFNFSSPSINDNLKWVKSVVRDIKSKAKIIHILSNKI